MIVWVAINAAELPIRSLWVVHFQPEDDAMLAVALADVWEVVVAAVSRRVIWRVATCEHPMTVGHRAFTSSPAGALASI